MQEIPNFYQWLSQKKGIPLSKLDSLSNVEIKTLKLEYRKFSKKEYNKRYRLEKVHRIIIFSSEEFEFLKKAAQQHNHSFSGFVKNSSLAYLKQEFILPSPQQTREVLVAFTKYGVLLNQIAHVSNASNSIYSNQISHIQNNFKELRNQVTKIYTQPYKLDQVISQTLENEPSYIEQIRPIVTPYL